MYRKGPGPSNLSGLDANPHMSVLSRVACISKFPLLLNCCEGYFPNVKAMNYRKT